jgi:hypothetical protein
MKEQINTNVRLSQDKKTVVVSKGGEVAFISVNLIKHLLDIPYTKKDGTEVLAQDILAIKQRSAAAYANAVLEKSKMPAGA